MSDDPIERLRAHVEKHKHHSQVFVSTAGLQALFDLLKVLTADNITLTAQRDVLKGQVEGLKFQIEHLEACVTIHDRNRKELKAQLDAFYEAGQQMTAQRNALKAQVGRLLADRAEAIGKDLIANKTTY